jgi:hypothetical protein
MQGISREEFTIKSPLFSQSIHLLLTETCHDFWSAQKKERDDIRPRAPKQGGSDAEVSDFTGRTQSFDHPGQSQRPTRETLVTEPVHLRSAPRRQPGYRR